jgi:hypothetical protein
MFYFTLLLPSDLTKDLNLRGSKAPRRTVATQEVGKLTQLSQGVAGLA